MDNYISFALLSVFIPTFFFVSITPGMCMTLSLTMGMTVGVKRSLHFMWGELIGVALVAIATVLGIAGIMLQHPSVFVALKLIGGTYLFYLGIQMCLSRGRMAMSTETSQLHSLSALGLASQGFITAIANPKGWAFFISLLPPFISKDFPLLPQIAVLITMILVLEFICLIIYATGGKKLNALLQVRGNVRIMNRVAGSLMMGVAVWLVLG